MLPFLPELADCLLLTSEQNNLEPVIRLLKNPKFYEQLHIRVPATMISFCAAIHMKDASMMQSANDLLLVQPFIDFYFSFLPPAK